MNAIQQILYAADTAAWHRLAEALGLVAPYPPEPAWAEFHGRGSLAVHAAMPDHPAGSVDLHVLVDDLDEAERALAGFDVSRGVMEGVGDMLTVTSGIRLTVAEGSAPARDGALAMQPIWFAPDLDEPRRILEALGLRPAIAADGGGWIELASDAGSVGLHRGEAPSVGLSFETPDVDALADRLREAGYEAGVVDEAFARTVRVPSPDGGPEVWINGEQDDLYGYHRAEE